MNGIWQLPTASKIDKGFIDQIQGHMLRGDIQLATNLCQQQSTPIARMVEKGLNALENPFEALK